MNRFLLVGVALAIGACASKPEAIKPLAVVGTPYAALSCEEIRIERTVQASTLATLAEEQLRQRSVDTLGVSLIGVPVGSLASGRERETYIAATKGKIAALDSEASGKGCPSAGA